MRTYHALGVSMCLALVLGGAGYSPPAQAQMYRCKTASGGNVVQDTPCVETAAAGRAVSAAGLDVLSSGLCAWWSYTVSLASDLNKCVLTFQRTGDGFTIDEAQVSVGGKLLTLHLFDSSVQDADLVPGVQVAGSERYSYASLDKSVQVYLSSALVPPRRADRDDADAYCCDRLRYRGNLTVKTGEGEKTVAIGYERSLESSGRSSSRSRSARKHR